MLSVEQAILRRPHHQHRIPARHLAVVHEAYSSCPKDVVLPDYTRRSHVQSAASVPVLATDLPFMERPYALRRGFTFCGSACYVRRGTHAAYCCALLPTVTAVSADNVHKDADQSVRLIASGREDDVIGLHRLKW